MRFDRGAWSAARGLLPAKNPRGGMVAAARAAGLVVGANREEVHALLGTPDSGDAASEIWDLGLAAYAPDEGLLIVRYDGDGRVVAIDERYEG